MAGEIIIRIQVPDGVTVAAVDYVEPAQAVAAAQGVFGDEVAQSAPVEQAAPTLSASGRPDPVVTATNGVPECPVHGQMRYYPAGTNSKSGKTYNASYRCPVAQCPTRPVWGV